MNNFLRLSSRYARMIGTPFALRVLKHIEQRDFEALARLEVSPLDYSRANLYFQDAQLAALFRKNRSLPLSVSTKAEAMRKWVDAEWQCAITNRRLRRASGVFGPPTFSDYSLLDFLERVKRRCSWWLGEAPAVDSLEPRFGPGVTLCRNRLSSTIADKIENIPTTTLEAGILFEKPFLNSGWGRHVLRLGLGLQPGSDYLQLVRSSRWGSVPKTALTDRSIEVGPALNVSYQLALGRLMKDSFARKGWDLRRSPDLHREIARSASKDSRFVTIDLASASDTVARELVRRVIPADWLRLFDSLRVPSISHGGTTVHLQKYSGMGNGYTFELESVIFMSIAQEVCHMLGESTLPGDSINVFGDDIIVSETAGSSLVEVLGLCGFKVNQQKTFLSGPFRESCGGDFFEGSAVRPFFLEEIPNEPQQWITFANGIRRVGVDHYGADNFVGSSHHRLWLSIQDNIPVTIRGCRGPEALGDIVLHDCADKHQFRERHSKRYYRCYRPVTPKRGLRAGGSLVEWDNFYPTTRLAVSLYLLHLGSHDGTPDRGLLPRGSVSGYKTGWVCYS